MAGGMAAISLVGGIGGCEFDKGSHGCFSCLESAMERKQVKPEGVEIGDKSREFNEKYL
ncbi:MAG TPA: hypothetical protein VNH18_08775 [Bryobacteraceae bacterium]|nr:hypothetical protein [Bryobacteraceae bacterium]